MTLYPLTRTGFIMLEGGCHCGAIRYSVDGPPMYPTNCHCSICRRTTGAPFVAWFTVAQSAFRWTRGAPRRYHSSDSGTRGFCSDCGTQLVFENRDSAEEIDITTCSLDDVEAMPPKDHTWVSAKPSWIVIEDSLPQFDDSPHDP